MKIVKHRKTETTSTKLSNKLSLILWSIINNNLISIVIYIALKILEFVLLSLMVLCLYGSINQAGFSTASLDRSFTLNQFENLNFIIELIIVSYLGVIAFLIVLLLSTKQKHGFY